MTIFRSYVNHYQRVLYHVLYQRVCGSLCPFNCARFSTRAASAAAASAASASGAGAAEAVAAMRGAPNSRAEKFGKMGHDVYNTYLQIYRYTHIDRHTLCVYVNIYIYIHVYIYMYIYMIIYMCV